ncbi:MAG: UDP-N-acetylglucosamine 1-carboxyvinyltransferase [Nitrospira sp. SB0677_bin_15]|nr:UDP-N-acetylglucosamine 1-carboxyvinyltransferase [Nitrospira sp. SB0667_bin_9]MYD31328.1 UDP-N-acetylglucosamine 1-carboxyvinyltransferase [Nitrospira sp. SB0661_bin_20]MYG39551.1 UDP-N-acetylglucosamine 1-carboxyvinyltransferase [Nitrospira sp. SB0677_bin_15]MYH03110.1 UDP-N-acetylglucosamine 1-carboxyvinyltransferase [Nitrospira sp. SB0675_bin_23]
MDSLIVTGGQRLEGRVRAGGAKNAALPILASTLLGEGECTISNLPQVRDVATMMTLLSLLGVSVKQEEGRAVIDATHVQSLEAPYDLVKTMRASILVLGPLLARFGEAVVSLPGGCAIGPRPVDFHLDGLRKLGATVSVDYGYIRAHAPKLEGQRIDFEVPTVTGTENLLMAACLAKGTTVINNAAMEPEIVDLADFLIKRGARISGAGSGRLVIEGVSALRGADHEVIPDRIEAGTYVMAGAMTGGRVEVDQCVPEHLEVVTSKLKQCGANLSEGTRSITIEAGSRLQAQDVQTFPYPGFPTDLQAQMMALMCLAEGTSVITELVFAGRFLHVPELQRMGAVIAVDGHRAVVKGLGRLTGAPVMASDLRASAALLLAGLAAEGETRISRIYHLERGYERIEDKLQSLGASVRREGSGYGSGDGTSDLL